jgi:glycosyltransferase involved in cell wall biosynthesis
MKTGYAKVAGRLSAEFTGLGHQVDVITEGRGCYRIGKIALLDKTGKAMFKGNHDIVQVIGPTPLFSEQCVSSAKKRGLPVVYMMNAFPGLSSYYHNPASGFVDSMYKKFDLYRKIRDVDLMVFHTNDFAQYFTSHYDGPFEVIPNGLDADELKGYAENLPRSNNRILFVGQLRRYKGLPYLIAAIKQLRDTGRDVVLDIVGGGPDHERILVLVASLKLQNAVFLHGELSGQELDKMYRQATVFALPSIEGESFGIVLLEAAARGVPIVASDLPGVREVVEYLGGTLARPRDSRALARTIAKALDTSEMGPRRTTPPDMTRFLWGKIAKRHIACYRELLGLAPETAPEAPGIPENTNQAKIGAVA